MSDQINENSMSGENEHVAMNPPCPNGQLYTVRSGDTMFSIARRANISLQRLIDANPQITDPNVIRPGQVICIPAGSDMPCPGGRLYRVVAGDTMYSIAQRFGVTLDALIRANPQITNPNEIFPGQEICIPGGTTVQCPNGMLYTVRAGDTLFEIARRNNITLAALVAANPQITNPDRIFPGQVICIPAAAAQPPAVTLPMPTEPPTMPPTQVVPPVPRPGEPPMGTVPAVPPMVRPCPTGYSPMPMHPMPVYMVVPWDECPYRRDCRDRKGKKRKRCK